MSCFDQSIHYIMSKTNRQQLSTAVSSPKILEKFLTLRWQKVEKEK